MAIPVLAHISKWYKPRSRYPTGQVHLKFAGINQEIFLRHWGMPEINISSDNLQKFFSLDFLPSNDDSSENDPITVWIYEKMDMFVLFRKGKLIAHFRWTEFKERSKKPKVKIDSGTQESLLPATTLSIQVEP
jgi:hypothetical protein